ncbi:peptidoglycan DD-metalloendopeptidase family protein [soil metagenome]
MLRAPSRVRTDYKPEPPPPSRRLRWFALGLVIPGLGGLIAVSTRDAGGTQQTAPLQVPIDVVASDPIPTSPPIVAALPRKVDPPLPQYDSVTLKVASGDTLDALFMAHNLDRTDLARMLEVEGVGQPLRLLRPGDEILVRHDAGRISELERRLDEVRRLSIRRGDDGFSAQIVEDEIERQLRHAQGKIESSLFEAGLRAGLSERLIMSLAGIFAWDVDFVLDIRHGDEFVVVYEEIWRDGELHGIGHVIAAEFVNNGRTFRAVRFVDPTGRADYYTPDGRSVRRAFLRAPVDFSRISSNFNLQRLHPIFKTVRPHRGVDYAAPAGTPVRAAGDGIVDFRGSKGGYGNAIILRHGGNVTTLYGHMSRFGDRARTGSRVQQGQIIGYVGQTGYATGPHLHYEYRLNGVHRNPRTVQLPQAEPIKSELRKAFLTAAAPLLTHLDAAKRTQMADAAPPNAPQTPGL